MLVRTHRPLLETADEFVHTIERKCRRFVVVIEIRIDGDAQTRTLVGEQRTECHALSGHTQRDERCHQCGVRVEQRAVEIEDRNQRHASVTNLRHDSRGASTEERLARPRNSPLVASSSHRALHAAHTQESRFNEARYNRSTSNESQYGHWKCSASSPTDRDPLSLTSPYPTGSVALAPPT